MKRSCVLVVLSLMLGLPLIHPRATSAQISGQQTRLPIQVGSGYLESQGAKMGSRSMNKMTPSGKAAMQQQQVITVPNWSGSFTYQGTAFPYTMVGNNPAQGGTTFFFTQLIPISFFFDEFVDQNGNNIVISASPIVSPFVNSPNFEPASYTSGFTQLGDAIQRAEFFNAAQPNWHNILLRPQMLTPVQVEVPVGSSVVLQSSENGVIFALIDFNFMVSQLNTILQLEPINAGALAIALTHNALFYDGTPANCCTLGFHTAFENGTLGNRTLVQTLAFANWTDEGIFVNTQIADVISISHEIAEWMNDPFVNNIVPTWTDPNGDGGCQNLLEVGDPVEGLPNPAFPVTIDGFTYHPQTVALLPWFSRPAKNTLSIGGAFSYPNTTTLTSPSQPCPTPTP
jgi:hypothetical protein